MRWVSMFLHYIHICWDPEHIRKIVPLVSTFPLFNQVYYYVFGCMKVCPHCQEIPARSMLYMRITVLQQCPALQVLVSTTGGDNYTAGDALKLLQDLNLTQQVWHSAETQLHPEKHCLARREGDLRQEPVLVKGAWQLSVLWLQLTETACIEQSLDQSLSFVFGRGELVK